MFHVVKRAILEISCHSEETLQVIKQSGLIKQLLASCNCNLGDWKAASANLPAWWQITIHFNLSMVLACMLDGDSFESSLSEC